MYKNGHKKESGQKDPFTKETKEDRTITKNDTKKSPAKSVKCRNCKKKGHYEKMCRILRRIQHLEKTTSSAAEDNWDYDKIQKINNNKKKGEYIYVTLLVNNAPIKIIIDSGSPVTLIPQSLFNDITRVEKMNIDYKDVNDNKIEFVGQTNATVKTNKTTLQLPLLIQERK